MRADDAGRLMRAAVLGSPAAHSLSPVLHRAAYAALGLDGWSYERVECVAARLPGWVRSRDASWVGVSVTMPGKEAALEVASSAAERAQRVGAANTLVRGPDGRWSADCTDVDGVAGALRAAGVAAVGGHAVVLGAGGTARAAVAGLAALGVATVTLVVRDAGRAAAAVAVARACGMGVRTLGWAAAGTATGADTAALVATTPAGVADASAEALVRTLPPTAVVLDAVYHPWPTPLAAAATARGLAVATGLDMLLHQAFGQVEQFTGAPAPRPAMHAALVDATGLAVRSPG